MVTPELLKRGLEMVNKTFPYVAVILIITGLITVIYFWRKGEKLLVFGEICLIITLLIQLISHYFN